MSDFVGGRSFDEPGKNLGAIKKEKRRMNLYLISRTDGVGYDEYDAFVVRAETPEQARQIVLDEDQPTYENASEYALRERARAEAYWAAATIRLLASNVKGEKGTVLGSFNAG